MFTGVVLAGGESRRFGRNKALEVFQGKALIDRSVESLRSFCDPVFVVANDLSPYYHVRATLIQDIMGHQGPLGGIYSALLFSPHDWIFVKATDMPFLVPKLVHVLQKIREKADADVVVPLYKDWYEPLLAFYHRRCLPFVAENLESHKRQIISFYKKVRVKTISEEEWRSVDPEGRSFLNVNTPEDWEQLTWS